MTRTILFLSRYAHFFEQTPMVACYHSLRMMPVYIPDMFLPIVKKFNGGVCLQDLLVSIDLKEQEVFLRTIDALENVKILIRDPVDDEKAINYFKNSLGKPYPHLVYFILTERCNFRCSYCFIKNNNPLGNMTADVALKGLDFFCRLIAEDPKQFDLEKTIVFYGGEPLLNWSVFEILLNKIKSYVKNGKLPIGTTLNLVTNGSLLTPDIARILNDHNVQVSISIDGDDFATNSSRIYANGEPVYEDVKRGFQICKEVGMDIGASCTLSEASISDFDNTIRVLLDECGVDSLGLNLMINSGEKMDNGYNERATKFILNAFQIFRKRGVYEDRIMRKASAFVENRVWPFDCGATGGNQIVIAPDRDVGICHGFVAEKKYFPTNVYDDDFDVSNDKDFREWSMRSPLNMFECQDCPALGICGGGCPFQSELESGSIWALDKRFCVHAKMTLEWLIWDLLRQMQIS